MTVFGANTLFFSGEPTHCTVCKSTTQKTFDSDNDTIRINSFLFYTFIQKNQRVKEWNLLRISESEF